MFNNTTRIKQMLFRLIGSYSDLVSLGAVLVCSSLVVLVDSGFCSLLDLRPIGRAIISSGNQIVM